jgi:hypothetical protein
VSARIFYCWILRVLLFAHSIYLYRNCTPDEKYGQLFVFSLRLALWMQIIGFSVRFLSSFIWIQMYSLGVSSSTPMYYEANDARNSFLSPRSNSVRRSSMADDILGGSIYDPSYYSSLFEDVRNNTCNHQVWYAVSCLAAFRNILNTVFWLNIWWYLGVENWCLLFCHICKNKPRLIDCVLPWSESICWPFLLHHVLFFHGANLSFIIMCSSCCVNKVWLWMISRNAFPLFTRINLICSIKVVNN